MNKVVETEVNKMLAAVSSVEMSMLDFILCLEDAKDIIDEYIAATREDLKIANKDIDEANAKRTRDFRIR